MNIVVGIDLGSSGATVSTIKKGSLDIILNEASKRKSPAIISYNNSQRYIGEPAVNMESSNAKNTIRNINFLIGRDWADEEFQDELSKVPGPDRYKEMPNGGVGIEVTHDDEKLLLDSRALLATQLSGLKQTSEKSLRENQGTVVIIRDVVISVPPYYSDSQRRAVLDAASIAGLNTLRLMNCSAAVALDYGMWKNARNVFDDQPVVTMFIDIGYSDSWCSIVSYTKGKLTTHGCSWDRNLGGKCIDMALVDLFATHFMSKNKGVMDPRKNIKALQKLLVAAEKAKLVLTPEGVEKTDVFIEYLVEEIDFSMQVLLEKYDEIVIPIAERLLAVIQRTLEMAKLTPADINGVEVVGGSSRVRHFKKVIRSLMQPADSKPPNYGILTTLNTDESVARGCALMCAVLSPQYSIQTTLEINELVPIPIKIQWEQPVSNAAASAMNSGATNGDANNDNDEDSPVVQGNSLLLLKNTDVTPKYRRVTFRRAKAFEVVASYDDSAEDFMIPKAVNKTIGLFNISGMPATNGHANAGKIAVTFQHDKSGIFSVGSVQLQVEEPPAEGSDKKKIIKTDLKVDSVTASLSPEEINKMRKVENNFQAKDNELRELADRRNELEEFVYSARSDIADKLKPFATAAETDALLKKLIEEENWLYEEEEIKLPQVLSRLSAVHTLYDAIKNRSLEVEAREQATTRFNNQINNFLTVVSSTSVDYAHITDEERDLVRKACDGASQWLANETKVQNEKPLNVDPLFTASHIDNKAYELKAECKPVVNKPKPSPPPVNTPTPPAEANEGGASSEQAADDSKMDMDSKDENGEVKNEESDNKMEVVGELD